MKASPKGANLREPSSVLTPQTEGGIQETERSLPDSVVRGRVRTKRLQQQVGEIK